MTVVQTLLYLSMYKKTVGWRRKKTFIAFILITLLLSKYFLIEIICTNATAYAIVLAKIVLLLKHLAK